RHGALAVHPPILVILEDERERLVVVLRVHREAVSQLLQVAQANRLPGLRTRLGENREQDRRQDGDDGYNHEQLDQRETPLLSGHGDLLIPRGWIDDIATKSKTTPASGKEQLIEFTHPL